VLLSEYIAQVRGLIHDSDGTDWTDTEIVSHINSARTTVALDTHCVRNLKAVYCIADQETYPLSGGIGAVTVTAGGSGYTSAPTVSFSGGSPSTPAAATATVSGGSVTSVTMTSWGSGYSSTPAVTFSGGGGSGAQATATALLNVLDLFSVTINWSNLRSTLDWHPFNAFQAFCRSNPMLRSVPAAWSGYIEQNLIYLFPIPDTSYRMEWDIVTLPSPLSSGSDSDGEIKQPYADAVQYYAAFLALMKMQQFDQANVLRNLYRHRIRQIQSTKQTVRLMSAYSTYLPRFVR